jgi:hypothetical protein
MITERTEKTVTNDLKQQLTQVLFKEVAELNSNSSEAADVNEDEGGLYMIIAQELAERKIENAVITDQMKLMTETIDVVQDTNETVEKGVWVYAPGNAITWQFNRYSTIADAVRAAIRMINAVVLYNGEKIIYDSLDEKKAYYIDMRTKEARIIAK